MKSVDLFYYCNLLLTPYPNNAKSPFSGSSGKTSDIAEVRRNAADMDAEEDLRSPRRMDCWTTCVSIGMMSVRRSMKSSHTPRSTGEPRLTIQRMNIQTRLHDDWVFLGIMPSMPRDEKYDVNADTAVIQRPSGADWRIKP